MTWQQKARAGIVVVVLVVVAMLVVALRQPTPDAAPVDTPRIANKEAITETTGGLKIEKSADGRLLYRIEADTHLTYPEGRNVLTKATITLPDRNGKTFTVRGDEIDAIIKDGEALDTATFKGNVQLTTSDGVEIRSAEAKYNSAEGLLTMPGTVTFTRGRMSGEGIGATYDQVREVLWLLDQAHITVAADPGGEGALDATAGAAGLARKENYAVLTRGGKVVTNARTAEADDITIRLTPDNARIRMLELRVNSRITGDDQQMSARDIDLTYGDDARLLQSARLLDNAVVQLPAQAGQAGRRIAARAIDMAMAPDGRTVTSLVAVDAVQLDLPAEAGAPLRRIRSARLDASGAGGGGLQSATFSGGVAYRETRAAGRGVAAVDRTARSATLITATAPGLGAIEQADFRGNVHITDAPDVIVQGPRVIYKVVGDQMEISPGERDPGPEPQVTNSDGTVRARTIMLNLATRGMKADTDVRSTLQPRSDGGRGGAKGGTSRVPSMLKQDEPVNVTANRLDYAGAGSLATYSGDVTLWQADTRLQAAEVAIDDKSGNLTATGSVRTLMSMAETDPKTKTETMTQTIGRAEHFVYDDARRLATYTTKAHVNGPKGDVTADKIELFLAPEASELERAEAYGTVTVREGIRTARGTRLTYTAADDLYVMSGTVKAPVVIIEDKPSGCEKTTGSQVTFRRAADQVSIVGPTTVPCAPTDRRLDSPEPAAVGTGR